jgi:hypothetical protein
LVNVWEKVWPGFMTGLVVQLGGLDVDLTLWPTESTCFQVTVPPTWIVTVAGANEKLAILTLAAWAEALLAALVAAEALAAEVVAVVGLDAWVLEPQAVIPPTSRPTAATAARRVRRVVRVITDCTEARSRPDAQNPQSGESGLAAPLQVTQRPVPDEHNIGATDDGPQRIAVVG